MEIETKKITVLGKTFNSEEERRNYFREELRKKLPELKQMEGFPIGEDEDILNLSDPPYYTACPNPWLNDFVAEWEDVKNQLVEKGLRSDDFEVDEPYAADVSEGKNNPIYMAHSYHTKVPHPAIMRYILHYTQPGDIVFDGFSGTGMTGVASSLCGNPSSELKYLLESELNPIKWGKRKYLGGDLSSIASFISFNYNNPVNGETFINKSSDLIFELKKNFAWLYETFHDHKFKGEINYTVWSDVYSCGNCNEEIVFWNAAVDRDNGIVKSSFECPHCKSVQTKKSVKDSIITVYDNVTEKVKSQKKRIPVLINYSFKGKRFEKVPDDNDKKLFKEIDNYSITEFTPKNRITEGDEIGRLANELISNASELFPKRTLIILSQIIKEATTENRFHLLVTSILQNVSWLYRWRANGKGGTTSGTYYICATPQENNVFNQLERKARDFTQVFSLLDNNNQDSAIFTSSSTCLNINSNSVDYIFTDLHC
jgi:hypothetical protein